MNIYEEDKGQARGLQLEQEIQEPSSTAQKQ